MDNVLIAIDSSESSFWLAYYAIGLTRRVRARVAVLMVVEGEQETGGPGPKVVEDDQWIGLPDKRIESLIAEQHSDQASIDFYVAYGPFEQEVPRFIRENSVTMLFVGQPPAADARRTKRFLAMLETIGSQSKCHIEVVHKVSIQEQP